ncbi:MAG: hypothetical protein ACXAD7_15160 [Candidatus Kariarchaeaceae archaeon]|jgi:hypothetical protein
MSYEIKGYSEEYIEKQAEIGAEVIDKWFLAGQTNAENLKQVYSQENFDRETKFYAFKENEMVGFLTSTIQPKEEDKPLTANLEFPIVLTGHEKEAQDLLLENAYKTLKEKGVEKILTRVSSVWGNTVQLAEKYGYKEGEVITKGSRIEIEKLTFSVDESVEFLDYNAERDDEALIKMYTSNEILTEDQIKGQLKYFVDNPELLISWKIFKRDDEIIASSLALLNQNDKTQAQFTIPITKEKNDFYTRAIFSHHLQAAREKGVKIVTIFLPALRFDQEEYYHKLGFEFTDLFMYEKAL